MCLPRLHAKGAEVFWKSAILYVLFVEDDCRLRPGIRLRHIVAAARRARGRAAWLGHSLRKGVPKIGAHMLCFSRASLVPFPTMAATVDPFGRRVWSPASVLAFQVRHELMGRQ